MYCIEVYKQNYGISETFSNSLCLDHWFLAPHICFIISPQAFFFQGILAKMGSRVSNRVYSNFGSVFYHKNKKKQKTNHNSVWDNVFCLGESVAMVQGNHKGTGRDRVLRTYCSFAAKQQRCLFACQNGKLNDKHRRFKCKYKTKKTPKHLERLLLTDTDAAAVVAKLSWLNCPLHKKAVIFWSTNCSNNSFFLLVTKTDSKQLHDEA